MSIMEGNWEGILDSSYLLNLDNKFKKANFKNIFVRRELGSQDNPIFKIW